MRRITLSILLFIFSSSCLLAQGIESDSSCFICREGLHYNKRPYRLGLHEETPFIAAGMITITSAFMIKQSNRTFPFDQDELNGLDRMEINRFDRQATYNWDPGAQRTSDLIRTGVLFLPAVFLLNHHNRNDFGSLFIMSMEVSAITYGLTLTIKHLVNRTRPLVYNPDVPLDERTNSFSRLSFISGHTSFTAALSFFFGKVMLDYHPNMKRGYKVALFSFSMTIPAVTGYLRVKGGKHFPTDVITGYLAGAAVGWLIPELHRRKSSENNFSVYPGVSGGSQGITLVYRF